METPPEALLIYTDFQPISELCDRLNSSSITPRSKWLHLSFLSMAFDIRHDMHEGREDICQSDINFTENFRAFFVFMSRMEDIYGITRFPVLVVCERPENVSFAG
jgi:hypothetical protein